MSLLMCALCWPHPVLTLMFPLLCFAEVHPLLGVKGDSKSKKKTAGRPKGSKGKDKEFVRSKPFRDRAFPLEPTGGAAGSHMSVGLKGRAEGLGPGKN